MHLEIDRETLIEGLARGAQRAIEATDAMKRFGDLLDMLAGMHLLKEDTLTPVQAARLLGISKRTFERQINEGRWTKIEALGYAEPRVSFREIATELKKSGKRERREERGADIDATALRDLVDAAVIAPHLGKRKRTGKTGAAA